MPATESLADACAAWQGGRDKGSSPIRAAARVLTTTTHYFQADFIWRYEREAEADHATMTRAKVLLDALERADRRSALGWSTSFGIEADWAGRGIASGPQDQQILETLRTGTLTMPLWGTSVDREVAESFGTRFIFELVGEFPAIPAWEYTGLKKDERELIVGGRYTIEDMCEIRMGTTLVLLRYVSTTVAAEREGRPTGGFV
jgi:hypothetical protein